MVQQRGGIHLYGGIGEEGDAYEQHADAVADAVVRSESAESLLDQAGSRGGPVSAVQRQTARTHRTKADDTTAAAHPTIAAASELQTAAQSVIDAAGLLALANTTHRFSDANAGRLNQAVEALGDVLHRSAGKRRRDDDQALRAALTAARGAADALSQFGHRNRHEALLRDHIHRIEELATEVQDTPVQRAKPADLLTHVERSLRQLDRAAEQVTPFAEVKHAELAAALETTRGWRDELADADDAAARRLSVAITSQQEILFQAAGELDQVLAGPALPTTGHVVAAYAHAMATSTERSDTANKVLAWARTENRRQLVHLAGEMIDDDAGNVATLKSQGVDARGEHAALDRQRDRLDRRLLAGAKVDEVELRELLIDSRAQAFDHRMLALEIQIRQFADALAAADEGVMAWIANRFERDIHTLPGELRALANVPGTFRDEVRRRRSRALAELGVNDGKPGSRDQREQMLAARTVALDYVEGQAQQWLASSYLDDRLHFAESELNDAQVRLTAATLATTVALTLAGNFLASAARGGMTGLTVGRGLTFARNAGSAAGFATDVAVNTVGQKVLLGDDASISTLLVLNAGGALLAGGISKQFHNLDDVERLGSKSVTLWQKVGRAGEVGLMGGIELSAQMVAGAAQDYVIRRSMGERTADPGAQSGEDWLLQGAAMALGRFIGSRSAKRAEHLETVVRDGVLSARARALSERALSVEHSRDVSAAVAMLGDYRELLTAEHTVLEAELNRHAAGDGAVDLNTLVAEIRANNRATAGLDQLDLPGIALRGAGLAPANAAAHAWEGTPSQVDQAIAIARKLGLEVTEADPGAGRRNVEIAGRRVDVVETDRQAAARLPASRSDGRAPGREGRVFLQGSDTEIATYAQHVRPLPGTLDVFVHGTVDDFIVIHNGTLIHLDHRRLATYIEKAEVHPTRVRLIACQSGAHPKGAAQHLANKLNVPVVAPTDLVHINQETGVLTVGPDEATPTGSWIEYTPAASGLRGVPWKDKTPTETRYERFKRERGDAAATEREAADVDPTSKAMGADGGDPLHGDPASEARARRQADAAAALSMIPITVEISPDAGRTSYIVTATEGQKIARSFGDIEGAQVIEFKAGLLFRHGGNEWYFEFEGGGRTGQGTARGERTRSPAPREDGGLPRANVGTVELWGFRGIREIQKPGESRARGPNEWTSQEQRAVSEATQDEPLLEFGHVGVSFDGGKTIHALTPKPAADMTMEEVKHRLKAGEVFPGRIRDDRNVFELAEQLANERGWSTRPTRAVLLLEPEVALRLHEQAKAQEEMKPGDPEIGRYGFPSRDEAATCADVNNCATYPRRLGIPIPEANGNLRDYIPALQRWADAGAPIDARGEGPLP